MQKVLIAAALVSLAAISAARADDRLCGNVPIGDWMNEQQIRQKAEALGLAVRKIEIDDGCYEVKARNRDGRAVDVYLNPQTGEQVAVDGD